MGNGAAHVEELATVAAAWCEEARQLVGATSCCLLLCDDASKLLQDYGLTCAPTMEIGNVAVRQVAHRRDKGVRGGGAPVILQK